MANETDHIEMYKRKFTKLEFLIRIRNRVQERLAEYAVDAEFLPLKAKRYKHDSPERINTMKEALTNDDYIANNKLTLQAVDKLIAQEQKKETGN